MIEYKDIPEVLNKMFNYEIKKKYAQELVDFIHANFPDSPFHTTNADGGDLRVKTTEGGKIFFSIAKSLKVKIYLQKNQSYDLLNLNATGDHVMKGKDVFDKKNLSLLKNYIRKSYQHRKN